MAGTARATRFRKSGKRRRGNRRRSTRRTTRKMVLYRRPNTHFFQRYAFKANNTLVLDANGQKFDTIHSMGYYAVFFSGTVGQVDMPSSTEFAALFDQYKLHSYTIEIRPRFNGQDAFYVTPQTSSTNVLPTLYWFFDTDDSTTPSSASDVMERPNVRSAVLTRPIYITVKYPCVAASMYNTLTTTGYASKRSPWIDINSNQVPHYGVKLFYQGAPTYSYSYDIRIKWRVSFKNPR